MTMNINDPAEIARHAQAQVDYMASRRKAGDGVTTPANTPTTDALIEAVARALFSSMGKVFFEADPHNFPDYDSDRARIARADSKGFARAALAAIEQGGTHVVVPVEPTDEMIRAAWLAMFDGPEVDSNAPVLIGAGFDAMLAARPKVTE